MAGPCSVAAEGDGVAAGAGRRDEDPAFVLFGLMLVGDAGESELVREPGDCLVIVADDERDMGEVRHYSGSAQPVRVSPATRSSTAIG